VCDIGSHGKLSGRSRAAKPKRRAGDAGCSAAGPKAGRTSFSVKLAGADSQTKCNKWFREEGRSGTLTKIFRQEGLAVRYHQITLTERYTLATLRKQVAALTVAEIARLMGRHRSTIAREIARNSSRRDRVYRTRHAPDETNRRCWKPGRNQRFATTDWELVVRLLREGLSPEQISGRLRLEGRLTISYESIYRFIRRDKERGGSLFRLLRQPASCSCSRSKTRQRSPLYVPCDLNQG
jgi:DNA-binding CsgD family transcriptional regulator